MSAWAACGCGGSKAGPSASGGDGSAAITDAGTVREVSATIDPTVHFQTMVGFGGAVAFDVNYLSDRRVPGDDIYQVLFSDLGLDILRIGNWYQNQIETGATANTPFSDSATVTVVRNATAALGHPPKILMASWSPPSYLKSTGHTKNGGTLVKQSSAYAYAQFAQWWIAALGAYATNGITPDYVSIQNEPDYTAAWETCRFDPTEGTNAAYGKALDAIYSALQGAGLAVQPQLVGPETSGIAQSRVQNYLAQTPLADVAAIAHHLYNGGGMGNDPAPDSFAAAMGGVATTASSDAKPVFMTEFAPSAPSMLNTAWLIHDAVTMESASAYIYWDLVWAPPTSASAPATGLVTLENPSGSFSTPKGYTVNDAYYAVKHFAKWVDAGWVRVQAASTSAAIKVSAFQSPDGADLTVVLLNTDAIEHHVTLDPGSSVFGTVAAYRTSGTTERTSQVAVETPTGVTMPGQSIVTLSFAP